MRIPFVVLITVAALGLALALQPAAAQTPPIPPAPRPATPPATAPPTTSAQTNAPAGSGWRLAPLTVEQWFTLSPQARVTTPGGQRALPGGPISFTQGRGAPTTLRIAMPQALAAEALRIDDPAGITLARDGASATSGTLVASRAEPPARLALTVRDIAAADTGLTATLSGAVLTAGPVTVQTPSGPAVVTVTTALPALPAAIGFEVAAAPMLAGREVEQAIAALAASRGFKRAVIGPAVTYTDLSAYGGAPVSDNLVVRIEAAAGWAPSGKRAEVRMVRFGPTGGLSLLNAAPEPGLGGALAISSVTDGPGVFALVGLAPGGDSRFALVIGGSVGSAAAVAALGAALYLWRRTRSKARSA